MRERRLCLVPKTKVMPYAVACRSEMHCPFRNMFCDHAQTARSVSSSTALAGLPPLVLGVCLKPEQTGTWARMDPLPGVCAGRSHFGSFLESPFEPHVMMTFVCAFVLQTLDDVGPKLDCFVFSFAQPLEFVVRTFLHPTPSAKPIPHDQ